MLVERYPSSPKISRKCNQVTIESKVTYHDVTVMSSHELDKAFQDN